MSSNNYEDSGYDLNFRFADRVVLITHVTFLD